MARLGELGTVITGNTPKTSDSENYASNDICFVKPSDIVEDEISMLSSTEFYISEHARSKSRILPKQSVLVTCIGIIGKVAINEIECSFNQQINAIIPNNNICNTKFLAYAIQSKKQVLQVMANAAVVPIINKKQFSDIEITIPPLEEQQHIAAVLDKVSELIDLRKKQLTKLDELVKARFVEMFGDPNNTGRASENKHKIGELCDVTKLAGFEFTEYISYQDSGEIIMLRGLNCKQGKLVLDNVKYIDRETSHKLPRSRLYKGDILMTYAGTIGDVAMVDEDDKYHLAPNVAKISIIDKEKVNPTFLVHLFMYSHDYIMTFASQVAQASINMQKIRDFEYIIPSIEEQNEFEMFATQLDKSKLTIQQNLDKLETLKKSLMQEYFG